MLLCNKMEGDVETSPGGSGMKVEPMQCSYGWSRTIVEGLANLRLSSRPRNSNFKNFFAGDIPIGGNTRGWYRNKLPVVRPQTITGC